MNHIKRELGDTITKEQRLEKDDFTPLYVAIFVLVILLAVGVLVAELVIVPICLPN